MMKLKFNSEKMVVDLAVPKGLANDGDLSTAVIISLLTDRRADADDILPEDTGGKSIIPIDRKGWAGDALPDVDGDRIGSRLWLLDRAKQTEDTRQRAVEYAKEALEWLIDDGHILDMVIPAGAIIQNSDSLQYVTDADITITAGVGSGSVTAVIEGASGNANSGIKLNLTSPISGIQSEATVASSGLTGGTDIETDTLLRSRIIARIQQPPNGGSKDDYIKWAKEVAGVTRAWVYPEQLGSGTVSLTFVMDDATPIIPTANDVTTVQSYIDGDTKKPVTADVTVFAPTPINVNFNITINPNTVAVQEAIKAEIEDLFKREASPGGTLYLSRIGEAISIATGEFDHTLNSPSADTVMNYGEMPMVGSFTWS